MSSSASSPNPDENWGSGNFINDVNDDWGSPDIQSADDGWGSIDDTQSSQQSNFGSEWDEFSNEQQQSQSNTGSDWDDFNNNQQQNQNNMNSGWDDFNSGQQAGVNNQQVDINNQQFDPNNQQTEVNNQQNNVLNNFQQGRFANLSKKTIALIILGACVLLALILTVIRNIRITPSSNVSQQAVQEEQNMQNQQQTQQNQGNQPVQNNIDNSNSQQQDSSNQSSGGTMLYNIDANISLSYSDNSLSADGNISNKSLYIEGSQILYCVKVSIVVAGSNSVVDYFCTADTYNMLNIGDKVNVAYQYVNDEYISINSISK